MVAPSIPHVQGSDAASSPGRESERRGLDPVRRRQAPLRRLAPRAARARDGDRRDRPPPRPHPTARRDPRARLMVHVTLAPARRGRSWLLRRESLRPLRTVTVLRPPRPTEHDRSAEHQRRQDRHDREPAPTTSRRARSTRPRPGGAVAQAASPIGTSAGRAIHTQPYVAHPSANAHKASTKIAPINTHSMLNGVPGNRTSARSGASSASAARRPRRSRGRRA